MVAALIYPHLLSLACFCTHSLLRILTLIKIADDMSRIIAPACCIQGAKTQNL